MLSAVIIIKTAVYNDRSDTQKLQILIKLSERYLYQSNKDNCLYSKNLNVASS